ncbi:NADH-quinone oxidoreductase subunit C [Meiothermus granaticius]|uniref:Formate hydrogenlyase subunit 5 n=1 Tax=Meiothermus granaticius NBRC 107808 TaxID=1227551 RepID=A0A399F607_9DEIN|nr:NADH-quinone oxidoreductase subunit C [Meiothermus granaticius]RIH91066.1 Formate hydrogenlyase subunit 5 [Meiothermus granaticius NBRC 107808]GEM87947.1 hydrogenase [Meiothermus granaticius NBRC 107808]
MEALKQALGSGRLVALWYDAPHLHYLVEGPEGSPLQEFQVEARGSFPSLAGEFPALDWFERELWEEHSLVPEGHPALKPLRNHCLPYPFERVEGLHEVPVGPVHAGIIEPGHFRFSVLGEKILHLELRLGYQHRGVERLFQGAGLERARLLAERAGGESVAHALAFCQAVEAALGLEVPPRARQLRRVLLELERVFGHLGHLAGLFTDIGYAYAATQVGKVRALLQGQLERLTGHRYGRNALTVGGVSFDLDPKTQLEVRGALSRLGLEAEAQLLSAFKQPMVLDRLRYVGAITPAQARWLGLVGPAARACGLGRDLRQDDGLYQPFTPVLRAGGDVLARAQVYLEEVRQGFRHLERFLTELPPGGGWVDEAGPSQEGELRTAFSRVEAGRGELFYWVRLQGRRVEQVKIVDPSFKNWRALELAVRGMGLPDFPLINKSFDLSYAGCDL